MISRNALVLLGYTFATFNWLQVESKPICGIELNMVESTTDPHWINQALMRTNEERRNHQVKPLKLNDELNRISQYWANQLATTYLKMTHTADVEEFKGTTCGENLYYRSSPRKLAPDGAMPIRAWYDEIKDYDFIEGKSSNGKKIEHFTQSVWKDTKEFGIAYASNPNGKTFVVATYWPQGNWLGDFTTNVLIGSQDMTEPDEPSKPKAPDQPTNPDKLTKPTGPDAPTNPN